MSESFSEWYYLDRGNPFIGTKKMIKIWKYKQIKNPNIGIFEPENCETKYYKAVA